MEFGLGILLGFVLGFFGLGIIVIVGIQPMDHEKQFKQDCQSMAHGTVSSDSPRICRKGNTILFTAK